MKICTPATARFSQTLKKTISPQRATMSKETEAGDIQDIRWGEGRWKEHGGRDQAMFICVIALKLELNHGFSSQLWFIFSWRVDYLLRLIRPILPDLIRPDQKLNPAACLTLSQEIMACRLLTGRAGRSHFHFVLTVRVPGMFLLHNNDKIYSLPKQSWFEIPVSAKCSDLFE